VHVVCGGGSGNELLRRLHLAGCELSAGPLNRGDSDEVLVRALELESVVEEAFCPISPSSLNAARTMVGKSEAVVVAPTAWGPGNVDCLALAEEALAGGTAVLLVDPRPERDFTGEQAWRRVQGLEAQGARVAPDVDALLEALVGATSQSRTQRDDA
jgi:iron complex transport system ATP-binding protein